MAVEIGEETVGKIDQWLTRYPAKQGALLPVLHAVQDELGALNLEAIDWIADKIEVSPATVYGVATFYPMFRFEPVGKHHIQICSTLPCAFCGGSQLEDALTDRLGIGIGETTDDGRFTLSKVECLAACHEAPAVLVNKKLHRRVTVDKIDGWLASLEDGTE